MKTVLYGASDDLIEIEGAISDEINCYNDIRTFEASDGTKGKIWYNNDGIWQISISKLGMKYLKTVSAVGDENKHTDPDAIGYCSYSDVAIWDGIDWIKIGRKTYNANH